MQFAVKSPRRESKLFLLCIIVLRANEFLRIMMGGEDNEPGPSLPSSSAGYINFDPREMENEAPVDGSVL